MEIDIEGDLSELGKAALSYVRMGLAVVPLKPRSKKPSSTHGAKEPLTDEGAVIAWWTLHNGDNVGIVAGASGLVIIDVDNHDVDGNASLSMWEHKNGRIPETVSACTPTGGMPYYYK